MIANSLYEKNKPIAPCCYRAVVRVPVHLANSLADILLACEALSVDVADDSENHSAPTFHLPGLPEPTGDILWPRWTMVTMSAIFASSDIAHRGMESALALVDLAASQTPWVIDALPDEDWVGLSQSQFTPQFYPPNLHIVASWHPAPAEAHLVLDPGHAFGTGTHPTTALCLTWLTRWFSQQQPRTSRVRAMDYGCGSGILALAAAFLGAGETVATDIDPIALEVCAANARKNHLHLRVCAVDEIPPQPYDVVMANILSGPLIALAPVLANLTAVGGQLLLSGILDRQAAHVIEAYAPWVHLSPCGNQEGWVALIGTKENLP